MAQPGATSRRRPGGWCPTDAAGALEGRPRFTRPSRPVQNTISHENNIHRSSDGLARREPAVAATAGGAATLLTSRHGRCRGTTAAVAAEAHHRRPSGRRLDAQRRPHNQPEGARSSWPHSHRPVCHSASSHPSDSARAQINIRALAPLLRPFGIDPLHISCGSILWALPWAGPLSDGDRLRLSAICFEIRRCSQLPGPADLPIQELSHGGLAAAGSAAATAASTAAFDGAYIAHEDAKLPSSAPTDGAGFSAFAAAARPMPGTTSAVAAAPRPMPAGINSWPGRNSRTPPPRFRHHRTWLLPSCLGRGTSIVRHGHRPRFFLIPLVAVFRE